MLNPKLDLRIQLVKSINNELSISDFSKNKINKIVKILEKIRSEELKFKNNDLEELLSKILNYHKKLYETHLSNSNNKNNILNQTIESFYTYVNMYVDKVETFNQDNNLEKEFQYNLLNFLNEDKIEKCNQNNTIDPEKRLQETLIEFLHELNVVDNLENNSYYALAKNVVEEKEIEFIYGGVKKYFDELLEEREKYNLKDEDLTSFFKSYLEKASDFYYDYLIDYDDFTNYDISKKIKIIYLFLKKELDKSLKKDINYKEEEIEEEEITSIESEDITKIDIINQPFAIDSLYNMYKREPKELELYPDYQRNFVWKPRQKSKLIESILLKIPLPTFYFDTRNEDQWLVIDGLQRLTTVFLFIDNEFKLTNLEYLKDLNGCNWKSLDRKYQRKIEKYALLCNLIRPGTPSTVASNIFQRINTLGTKLEMQEIRNSMFIGKSTKLLGELSKSKEFRNIITEKKVKTYAKRREDYAIILRYLAFKITDYSNYVSNNMPHFLGKTMETINNMDDLEITSYKNTFLECMRKAEILFEKDHFAKPSKRKDTSNPISKPLFESIGYVLDKYTYEDIEEYHLILRKNIYELYENQEFILKTSVATNNVSNVKYRFEQFQELFKEIIGY